MVQEQDVSQGTDQPLAQAVAQSQRFLGAGGAHQHRRHLALDLDGQRLLQRHTLAQLFHTLRAVAPRDHQHTVRRGP